MGDDSRLKLVDSNILVYAYDKSNPVKHMAAKEMVKEIWLNNNGALSIQNLAEFYSIVTKKIEEPISPEIAKQILVDLIEGFEIFSYSGNTIVNAANMQMIYGMPFWDSLIVATMEEHGIDAIITEDENHFRKVRWIKAINPFK